MDKCSLGVPDLPSPKVYALLRLASTHVLHHEASLAQQLHNETRMIELWVKYY